MRHRQARQKPSREACQNPLRLAQGQIEHRSQAETATDRQIAIDAPFATLGTPAPGRIFAQPQRHRATFNQRSVVGWPVGDASARFWRAGLRAGSEFWAVRRGGPFPPRWESSDFRGGSMQQRRITHLSGSFLHADSWQKTSRRRARSKKRRSRCSPTVRLCSNRSAISSTRDRLSRAVRPSAPACAHAAPVRCSPRAARAP